LEIEAPDLREACIQKGLEIIGLEGLEKLSLREVARQLKVSHQAPYKHFASRDHILAEIVARVFGHFAQFLDQNSKTDDPDSDLALMGVAYLTYAARYPLQYRLMFGSPLPDGESHPLMMKEARHAFELLCNALKRKDQKLHRARMSEEVVLDALFIWSGLHGLASISSSSIADTLGIEKQTFKKAHGHLLMRFGTGIS
jgi:AcrR family transcriptional regulator